MFDGFEKGFNDTPPENKPPEVKRDSHGLMGLVPFLDRFDS